MIFNILNLRSEMNKFPRAILVLALVLIGGIPESAIASQHANAFGPTVNNLALRIEGRTSYNLSGPILVIAEIANVGNSPVSVMPAFAQLVFTIRDANGNLVPTKDPIGCLIQSEGREEFNQVIQPRTTRMDPAPRDLTCYAVSTGTYTVTATAPIYATTAVGGKLPIAATLTSNTIQITIQ